MMGQTPDSGLTVKMNRFLQKGCQPPMSHEPSIHQDGEFTSFKPFLFGVRGQPRVHSVATEHVSPFTHVHPVSSRRNKAFKVLKPSKTAFKGNVHVTRNQNSPHGCLENDYSDNSDYSDRLWVMAPTNPCLRNPNV